MIVNPPPPHLQRLYYQQYNKNKNLSILRQRGHSLQRFGRKVERPARQLGQRTEQRIVIVRRDLDLDTRAVLTKRIPNSF